ncbi:MAG TPA: SIMPL domain-containing protein [Aquabacterium sp.]|uniref:SIMPL domain-containing protein n=1 Tax=Aquabacterium sp. TaxID=1872578 RepID=UPI002E34F659|nr:SIMPL domain-containing protein [Aquabacterium sp.]HEX5374304.1 SIMPL domain-containing protein [Aquabacterium sp.]
MTLSPLSIRPIHPLSRRATLALAVAVLGAASPLVQADQAPERRNVVSFSTSATQEITQDLLVVTLQAQRDGSVAAEVQADLKKQLDAALSEARKAAQPEGMEVRTGAFSIQPRYNNQGRITGWQGRAQLVLQGTDMSRIAQTAGRINELNIIQVGYGLSRKVREHNEAELTAQAIASFRGKAQDMAKAFGFNHYALGEVAIQSGEPGFEMRPQLAMMKSAMADSAAAPLPVEPGKGVVTVTVSGHVILTP